MAKQRASPWSHCGKNVKPQHEKGAGWGQTTDSVTSEKGESASWLPGVFYEWIHQSKRKFWGNLNIRLNHTLASSTYKLYFPFAQISQFMSESPQVIFSPFRSSRANNFRTGINIFQDTFRKDKNWEWIKEVEERMCISSRLYTSEVEDKVSETGLLYLCF